MNILSFGHAVPITITRVSVDLVWITFDDDEHGFEATLTHDAFARRMEGCPQQEAAR